MPTPLSDAEIQEFRNRLCAEAERQFLGSGVAAVTMRSLAAGMGCSATTPYRYFKNKNEILATVRVAILDRFCDRLEATRKDDGLDWTKAHLKAFVDFAFEEPESYRLIFDLYQSDENEYPEFVRANERARKVGYGYVQKLVEDGYQEGDPEQLAFMFFAQLHGFIVLRMTGRPPSTREQFDKMVHEAFRLISSGTSPLRASPAKAGSRVAGGKTAAKTAKATKQKAGAVRGSQATKRTARSS
ncbi:TetR/AcrR family transcriptional regulator [Variovorax sp. GB1P17]|uniref:TetR/AcrR family transcriptional regulator n=1 Tax=Variovorax sp. GB1P17 TaxID=3443740 RepID=UPI003F48BCD7